MIELVNDDNNITMYNLFMNNTLFDLVYADCIYESTDFKWFYWARRLVKENGIIMVQTDYHTVATYKLLFDNDPRFVFVNWLIYIQEWGGTSKRYFPRKHDDILVYARGKNYKFYPDRVQIPKATAGTKLDKKGTGLKTPMDVFCDLGNFSTLDKERIKWYNTGKNIEWQKPLKLMNRLLLPFTDVGDSVLDPFMGSGSTGVWCKQNERNFVGIENDTETFLLASKRIEI